MRVVSNREIERIEETERNGAIPVDQTEPDDAEIAGYVKKCFEAAKRAKEQGAETQILSNMQQIDGKYSESKLAAIKEIGGSQVFMMITNAKCKNAFNWVQDILLQPNQRIWGLDPTPLPELPEPVMQEIYATLMTELIMQSQQLLMQQGIQPSMQAIQQTAVELAPKLEENVKTMIVSKAKKMAEDVELKIDDAFKEGGWDDAIINMIPNIIMHTGFLKGPIPRKRNVVKVRTGEGGLLQREVNEEIIATYESRHPIFIYPSPDSTGIDDGYLIDRIRLTPIALQLLIDVPGYSTEEIRAVLEEARNGKLSEWLPIDREIRNLNDETLLYAYDSDKIDCLEFWGYVDGQKIIDWGLTTGPDGTPIDPVLYYNIVCYLIGNHVIKIGFNKDPLGRKPFYKASFEEREGSFWGKGLPEIIADVQSVCNACARAIVNNIGIASGPQVERNIDRIPAISRSDNHLIPWKVWDVTESTMSTSPALNFYQPPMVVERLMSVYSTFSKIADEHSGVPAFAHGDPNVGGAGNTASGLSMLMGSASRGIKAIISQLDKNIIMPSVERQYALVVEQTESYGMICDYQVVTLGHTKALIKEQLASRRLEFMQMTANPIDMQILGMEGRKYLLEETAKSISLDLTRVFAPPPPTNQPPPEGGAEPPTSSKELDAAGNPVVGTDTRTAGAPPGSVTGPAAPPVQPRAMGGPVDAGQPYLVGEQGPEVVVPETNGVVIPNEVSQTPITDGWGDEVYPSAGKKSIWSRLPLEDRAEDILMLVNKQRSFGPTKDATFTTFYENAGGNPVKAAEDIAEMMESGDLPHMFMWESPNTNLKKHKR